MYCLYQPPVGSGVFSCRCKVSVAVFIRGSCSTDALSLWSVRQGVVYIGVSRSGCALHQAKCCHVDVCNQFVLWLVRKGWGLWGCRSGHPVVSMACSTVGVVVSSLIWRCVHMYSSKHLSHSMGHVQLYSSGCCQLSA